MTSSSPATSATPAGSRASGASRELFRRAARAAGRRGMRVAAASTTPAAAAAWRPSSSPACRSTAPTRSACSATARRCSLPATGRRSGPAPAGRPLAPARPSRGRGLPDMACNEDPLAEFLGARHWRPRTADGKHGGLVRVGRRGAAAGEAGACRAPYTSRCWPAPSGGVTLGDNVAAFGELGFIPRIATGVPASARWRRRCSAAGRLAAGDDLADRRPGGAPEGELAGRACRGRRRHRDGAQLVREQADRGRRRGEPADVLPGVLARRPGADRGAAWTRAREAGAKGLIVTLDWSLRAPARLGQPGDPRAARPQTMARSRRGGRCARAGWSPYLRSGGPPDLTVPNMAPPGGEAPTFFGAYGEWMGTPPPSWDDIAWLREQWGGPFLVKGVMHPDDARRAVDAGADAISVSNHGGNNLDGTPASIRALPGGRRRGRRRGRGPARRRRPARLAMSSRRSRSAPARC